LKCELIDLDEFANRDFVIWTNLQAVVATGEGNLVYLELGEGGIEQKGHVKLDAEVSCVDISPLADDGEAATLLAVGTWDMRVHIFSLPAMAPLVSEPLGGEVIPRSVLFAGELDVPHPVVLDVNMPALYIVSSLLRSGLVA
jgi:hypothetical protein